MDLRIEPPRTLITHTPTRRVEPIVRAASTQPADPASQLQTRNHADPIPFADYLEKSNLSYPAKPFWATPTDSGSHPDSPKPDQSRARPTSDMPKIGDVSPVEQQRVTQHYQSTMRIQRTINLGSIVDIMS